MEKYTGAKTIGDGTYGSVLKAINKQNGECLLVRYPTNFTALPYRWNRRNQKDEKEVPSMGPMHHLEGDLVIT